MNIKKPQGDLHILEIIKNMAEGFSTEPGPNDKAREANESQLAYSLADPPPKYDVNRTALDLSIGK